MDVFQDSIHNKLDRSKRVHINKFMSAKKYLIT